MVESIRDIIDRPNVLSLKLESMPDGGGHYYAEVEPMEGEYIHENHTSFLSLLINVRKKLDDL